MFLTANTWPRAKTIVSTLVQPQVLTMGSPVPATPSFISPAHQAVPSTSSYEEVAPMDPTPSKVSFYKLFIIVIPWFTVFSL